MAQWRLSGEYFENCSCEVVCPCTASLALGADNDYCRAALVFHMDSGEVDGVDVSGTTVAAVAESGRYMHEGNWKLGLLIDESASDEQAEKLQGVFTGQLGGQARVRDVDGTWRPQRDFVFGGGGMPGPDPAPRDDDGW